MAAIVPTADMTGTRARSFKYNEQDVPVRLTLKGDAEITVTFEGLPGGTAQIKDGKLQGDNVAFWNTVDYQGARSSSFTRARVAGDEIKFEDGTWGTQFKAKKA
jgi:hypothetical protein